MTRAVLGVASLDVSGLVCSLLRALSPVVGSTGNKATVAHPGSGHQQPSASRIFSRFSESLGH